MSTRFVRERETVSSSSDWPPAADQWRQPDYVTWPALFLCFAFCFYRYKTTTHCRASRQKQQQQQQKQQQQVEATLPNSRCCVCYVICCSDANEAACFVLHGRRTPHVVTPMLKPTPNYFQFLIICLTICLLCPWHSWPLSTLAFMA